MNYYNEHDPKAAAWLRELIKEGHIPPGEVDERSIVDVCPTELDGFTQCHFFAGIGGWSYALKLANWPTDRPVWTGSCPCQPFSAAGKQRGTADERHLWPEFRRLIAECRPATVFGEQVASELGRQWLAGVFADVEELGYAGSGADLCAAGVGEKGSRRIQESVEFLRELEAFALSRGMLEIAERLNSAACYVAGLIIGPPHIRQRLFWVAKSGSQLPGRQLLGPCKGAGTVGIWTSDQSRGSGSAGSMADPNHSERRPQHVDREHVSNGSHEGRKETHSQLGACRKVLAVGLVLSNSAGREPREPASEAARHGNPTQPTSGIDRLEHSTSDGREQRRTEPSGRSAGGGCGISGLGDATVNGREVRRDLHGELRGEGSGKGRELGGVADVQQSRLEGHAGHEHDWSESERLGAHQIRPATQGSWSRYDILPCLDGKARRVESGTFPLAHGVSGRVGLLRGYGNAIVPQVAAEFIKAFLES